MVTTSCLQLSLRSTPANVRVARTSVAEAAAAAGARPDTVEEVRLCVDEAVTNAVTHAYDQTGDVEVTVERSSDELVVVVADQGKGMRGTRLGTRHGCGLELISTLTKRYVISSAPCDGTTVRMIFPLE